MRNLIFAFLYCSSLALAFNCHLVNLAITHTDPLDFLRVQPNFLERDFIGLLVKVDGAPAKLVVSSYVAIDHRGILKELQQKYPRNKIECVWGGELKVQVDPLGRHLITRANETSSLMGEVKTNSVEELEKWLRQNEPRWVAYNFRAEKYDPNNLTTRHLNRTENQYNVKYPKGVRHEIHNFKMVLDVAASVIKEKEHTSPQIANQYRSELLKLISNDMLSIAKYYYRELLVEGVISSHQYGILVRALDHGLTGDKMLEPKLASEFLKVFYSIEAKIKSDLPIIILDPPKPAPAAP